MKTSYVVHESRDKQFHHCMGSAKSLDSKGKKTFRMLSPKILNSNTSMLFGSISWKLYHDPKVNLKRHNVASLKPIKTEG